MVHISQQCATRVLSSNVVFKEPVELWRVTLGGTGTILWHLCANHAFVCFFDKLGCRRNLHVFVDIAGGLWGMWEVVFFCQTFAKIATI